MAYIPKNYARLEVGYREKALKLFPWVCGRCSREFVYSNLRELTVHHIDHDHSNNPEDGSNWEMLCLYCHDHEHSKYTEADLYGSTVVAGEDAQKSVGEAKYNPFAGLTQAFSVSGFKGRDRLRRNAEVNFQLLFTLHHHLPVGIDGHMLRVNVVSRLPEHHQLQTVLFLFVSQRHAVRPFTQLNRRRQALINFRRHTVNNPLNFHLPPTPFGIIC